MIARLFSEADLAGFAVRALLYFHPHWIELPFRSESGRRNDFPLAALPLPSVFPASFIDLRDPAVALLMKLEVPYILVGDDHAIPLQPDIPHSCARVNMSEARQGLLELFAPFCKSCTFASLIDVDE